MYVTYDNATVSPIVRNRTGSYCYSTNGFDCNQNSGIACNSSNGFLCTTSDRINLINTT